MAKTLVSDGVTGSIRERGCRNCQAVNTQPRCCQTPVWTGVGHDPSARHLHMKMVVTGREAGKIIWNTQFADFAVAMGFIPKVCRVRVPQTKGKVERLVRYVKDNFFPGRNFTDLENLHQQALSRCKAVDSKPRGTTGKIPLQLHIR